MKCKKRKEKIPGSFQVEPSTAFLDSCQLPPCGGSRSHMSSRTLFSQSVEWFVFLSANADAHKDPFSFPFLF